MKTTTLLLFFSFAFNIAFCQNEVAINHYQRKVKTNNLILPNQEYSDAIYMILIPKTEYSAGEISVKNFINDKIKCSAEFKFSNNHYTEIRYVLKSKKDKESLAKKLRLDIPNNSYNGEQNGYSISLYKNKKKYILTLKKLE
jgi:hypothetical protein